MDLGLSKKVAVVAGGSRGCGRGISEALAADGAAVVLSGRERDAVDEAVADIRKNGGRAHGVVADASVKADSVKLIAEARRTFADPDILVINPRPPTLAAGFDQTSDEDFRDSFETWVMTIVFLAREVLPAMQRKRWGRIINLGSVGMKVLHLEDLMYSSNTRVAAAGVIKTLAHEYGQFNITANTIATGPFMSGLTRTYIEKDGALTEGHMLAKTAMKRWGRVEEMGSIVTFLCSEQASFITGETIRVDGGYAHSLF